jgi:hypothetical protein
MKCIYFLQTLRDVPLGYHFRLYTYGPFDADVLSDLSLAERLGAIHSELLQYAGGHRYEIRAGDKAEQVRERARPFLDRYQDDIGWVVRSFGDRSARDLETVSTLVFVDRSAVEHGDRLTLDELVQKVHDVKPHLTVSEIEQDARTLKEQGLIEAH